MTTDVYMGRKTTVAAAAKILGRPTAAAESERASGAGHARGRRSLR
jgi:hypothetical protein